MNKVLDVNEITQDLEKRIFPYELYKTWLDDEIDESNFSIISITNLQVRPREKWNTEGREIYEEKKMLTLVEEVLLFLEEYKKASSYLFCHDYELAEWFPLELMDKSIDIKKNEQKINQLNLMGIDFDDNQKYGIYVEEGVDDFFKLFIDYSYLMRYRDVVAIPDNLPILVRFSSHLSVDFISDEKLFFQSIDRYWNRKVDLKKTVVNNFK